MATICEACGVDLDVKPHRNNCRLKNDGRGPKPSGGGDDDGFTINPAFIGDNSVSVIESSDSAPSDGGSSDGGGGSCGD